MIMKKLLLFVVVAMSVVACTQNVEGVDTSLGYTKLTVGMPSSRTELGEKINGVYQVYWSEGDQIVVNGAASTKMTIGENKKSATFHFENSLLESPYYLTYPYTEGSLCENGRPTVTFTAEQTYFAKSFGVGYAPMCGYCEQGEASVSHLAGVLRFAITGNTTLATIEVIADNGIALSGEFDVDCQAKIIAAIEGKVSNKITYTANQPLSEETTLFHITVPYGNLGKCQVVLTDNVGVKMNLKWTATDVQPGVVREFKPFAFNGGAELELQEMESVTDDLEIIENPQERHDGVWGYVKYSDETPAAGVSVSDGFSVVVTDENGFYQFESGVNAKTKYIYLSLPSTAKVTNNLKNQVNFFKTYAKSVKRYNFTLEKIEKENDFTLFVIADTHGARPEYISRLERDCLGGVKAEKQRRGATPCYAVILGDIVCSVYTDTSNDKKYNPLQPGYMDDMRNMFAMSNTDGVPTFFVMGNHDYDRAYFDNPPYSDYAEFNYHAQDCYEEHFGPADYSFNRGDVHIICMRDQHWPESSLSGRTSAGKYCAFMEYQVEWLRQDLANVSTDKMVVLCVHDPLWSVYDNDLRDGDPKNTNAIVALLKPYANKQIFAGDDHISYTIPGDSEYYKYSSSTPETHMGIDETTFVGNWSCYNGRCGGDGTPYGFGVYDFSGNAIANNYFRPCTMDNYDPNYQMRVYLSDMVSGKGEDTTSCHGWYGSYYVLKSTKYLYVNVFNGDDRWSVDLYINGAKQGSFAYMKVEAGGDWVADSPWTWTDADDCGTGTQSDPRRPSVEDNTNDWWMIGGWGNIRTTRGTPVNAPCYHMFRLKISSTIATALKNGTSTFEVRATDIYNNTYTCSKLFDADDLVDYAAYPEFWQ